jgi:glutamate synthase (NADPH/NADH) large chain
VNCNLEMVELEKVTEPADVEELRTLIENHLRYTGSTVARKILDRWNTAVAQFHKVMPVDYKRALKEMAAAKQAAAR